MSNNIVDESTFKKLSKTNNSTLLSDLESTFKKLIKTNNNIVDDESTFKKLSKINNNNMNDCSTLLSENDGWNEKKNKEAREAYTRAHPCESYNYYIRRVFPEEEELVKCPTCEEMIYSDEQNGMCYTCFKNEEKLYPDDIPMELRYKN